MRKTLGFSQLKAWGMFVNKHSRILREVEKALDREGSLPLHWYDTLFVLSRAPQRMMRHSEIAETIITSRSALTRSLDKLEEIGYIKKQQCPKDGRGLHVILTNDGIKALKKAWPVYRKAVHEHFGQYLSTQDAKILEKILTQIKFESL